MTSDMVEECYICLLDLVPDKSWTLPCQHRFHRKCITRMYRASKSFFDENSHLRILPRCPMCRATVRRDQLPPRRPRPPRPLTEDESQPTDKWMNPVRLVRNIRLMQMEDRKRAFDNLMTR